MHHGQNRGGIKKHVNYKEKTQIDQK